MARQSRRTLPLETLSHGTLTEYAEIDRHLSDGELRGRRWVFDRATTHRKLVPDVDEIRDLHRAMFAPLLSWAGEFRKDARGPGGVEFVPWYEIPLMMRTFVDDLKAWCGALPEDPSLREVAHVIADAHHTFQRIHPFEDTNGRTGRVFDLYLLWVTFQLAGASLPESRVLVLFPTDEDEGAYYNGLASADNYRPEALRNFYERQLATAFESFEPTVPPPAVSDG